MAESDLQHQCNQYLEENGILYFHLEKGSNFKQAKHSKGLPDLLIWNNSRSIFIELKKEGESQSAGQIEWERKSIQAGIPYYIARNFYQFEIILEKENIL